jgi:phage virion morphogenesis protein
MGQGDAGAVRCLGVIADDVRCGRRQVATALLRNVEAPARRKLLRTIARDIRKSQSDRIAAQQNPDGTPFEPRRQQATRARARKGRIRKQVMFRKLRMSKHLKAGANDAEAWLGFGGRVARIARVHQEGLADSPAPGMKKVRYARRLLLGLTDPEQERMLDLLLPPFHSSAKP